MILSKEQREEIKKRCNAAYPGPYVVRRPNGRPGVWAENGCKIASVEAPWLPSALANSGREQMASFFAHARTDIPDLLETIEALEEWLACLTGDPR